MNCTECKELLVEYIEGLLGESQKQAVSEHLSNCQSCESELTSFQSLEDRLVKNGKAVAQSNLEGDVMNEILRKQRYRLKSATKAGSTKKLRNTIVH